MSSIKGTNVIAPVVPFDTTDTHPSHEARYGRGGYRSVADIAERDAIPALRREAGMLVCVLTDGKVWKLGDNLTTWTEFAVSSDWATLSGKPSTFPPSSHTHTASQISDFASAVAAAAPPTTNASLLTSGTLSDSRLSASVVLTTDGRLSDARTPVAHSHAVSDVTGLQTALDAKQAAGSYAAASHTHTAGQVSGLSTVATTGSYADLTNKPTIPAAVTSLPAASITGLATVATSGSYADLSNKPTIPSAYSLPVATSSVLGGVKQGSNVTISEDGTVSVAAPVTTLAAGAITGLAAVATSGSYADLSGVPASFTPSAHNQAWSTITSTPTTLSGYGITDAVGSSDSRLTDARTPTSHTHALSEITQSGATSGQVVTWSGTAWAPATPSSGGSSLEVYAATTNFPAIGSATVLYLTATSRLYRWVAASSVYAEVGASGLADTVDGGSYA
jgi:hypothetical protein